MRRLVFSIPALASAILGFVWYWKHSRSKPKQLICEGENLTISKTVSDHSYTEKSADDLFTSDICITVTDCNNCTCLYESRASADIFGAHEEQLQHSCNADALVNDDLSCRDQSSISSNLSTVCNHQPYIDEPNYTKNNCEVGNDDITVNGNENIIPTLSMPLNEGTSFKIDNGSVAENDNNNVTSVLNSEATVTVSEVSDNVQQNSDSQSELSCDDSGKGTSIPEYQPIWPMSNDHCQTVCKFEFPSIYCGLLIGRGGHNIKELMNQSGSNVLVQNSAYGHDIKTVVIEGTAEQINIALEMLHYRFPQVRYPDLCIPQPMPQMPLSSDLTMSQLSLVSGALLDVMVSSVVSANHIFVQQPTHPSFFILNQLTQCMDLCYNNNNLIPLLPQPVEVGVICVAPALRGWYRAQIIQVYPENDECDVKFVDFGGYAHLPVVTLRQIRSDFVSLPFQAVECYLSNIAPLKDSENFLPEAGVVLEQLVYGQKLQAEVIGWEEDGVPWIQLYHLNENGKVDLLNRELVNRGVARWIEHVM